MVAQIDRVLPQLEQVLRVTVFGGLLLDRLLVEQKQERLRAAVVGAAVDHPECLAQNERYVTVEDQALARAGRSD